VGEVTWQNRILIQTCKYRQPCAWPIRVSWFEARGSLGSHSPSTSVSPSIFWSKDGIFWWGAAFNTLGWCPRRGRKPYMCIYIHINMYKCILNLQIDVEQVEQGQGICPVEPLHLTDCATTRPWTFSNAVSKLKAQISDISFYWKRQKRHSSFELWAFENDNQVYLLLLYSEYSQSHLGWHFQKLTAQSFHRCHHLNQSQNYLDQLSTINDWL